MVVGWEGGFVWSLWSSVFNLLYEVGEEGMLVLLPLCNYSLKRKSNELRGDEFLLILRFVT